jgi:hypothetical protein
MGGPGKQQYCIHPDHYRIKNLWNLVNFFMRRIAGLHVRFKERFGGTDDLIPSSGWLSHTRIMPFRLTDR